MSGVIDKAAFVFPDCAALTISAPKSKAVPGFFETIVATFYHFSQTFSNYLKKNNLILQLH